MQHEEPSHEQKPDGTQQNARRQALQRVGNYPHSAADKHPCAFKNCSILLKAGVEEADA